MDTPEQVIPAIAQIGLSVIFLWQWSQGNKERQETLKKKDELHERVLEAFQENARTNLGVQNALDNNTKVTKGLSELVYEVLKEERK